MKLSKNTLNIIKNFSLINTNLLIVPGNRLSTISPVGSVYADAKIEESFDQEFGIYDLNEFLSVISIFNDPDFTFDDKVLHITEGKNKVRYMSADKSILRFKTGTPKFPADCDISFELTAANLQQITRSAAVLKVPFVSVVGKDGACSIIVTDKSNPNSNQFQIEVGDTSETFVANMKVEYLKMIPDDYEVYISSERKACKMVGEDKMYLIALETDSSFSK